MSDKTKKRVDCTGQTRSGRQCPHPAVDGSTLCTQHHPDHAELRKARGRIRHPKTKNIAGELVPVSRSRSIAGIIDRIIEVVDMVEIGALEAQDAGVMIKGLVAAREGLENEWERQHPRRSGVGGFQGQPGAPADGGELGQMVRDRVQ